MTQRIGNVGLLNLVNATPESVKGIESIRNVGMVLYRKETAHLLTELKIDNVGASLEIPEGYSMFSGNITIDRPYLEAITEPTHLLVSGNIIFDKNLEIQHLKKELQLIISGDVFVPTHLSGAVNVMIHKGSGSIIVYEDTLPRIENGVFTLSNSFLESIEQPLWLVVNGVLTFDSQLDLELFDKKIKKLEVKGVITLFEGQESAIYKKASSLTACKLEVIPDGHEVLKNLLRLTARSIRRFKNKKFYTKKPIIIESDVTREMLTNAITAIHSKSFIVCHEQVEDLIYEVSSVLDAEVLSYEHHFVLIEGDEVWSNEQFLALKKPTTFIVNGQLILDPDVKEEILLEKIATIDILGEVIVPDKKLKGSLQNLIRVFTGSIEEANQSDGGSTLKNIGELSL